MRGGGAGLQKLEEAATELLAEATLLPADLDAALAFLQPLRVQINRCELAFAQASAMLGELEVRDRIDLTAIQLLRYECHMPTGAAGAAVNVGEQMDRVPASRSALEDGRIGFAHLNLIARTAEFCGDSFREGRLLKKAEKLDVSAFAKACTH